MGLSVQYKHWKTDIAYEVICSVWEYPTALREGESFPHQGKNFLPCGNYAEKTNIIFYENDEGNGYARSSAEFDEIMPNGQPRFAFVEGSE